MMWGDVGMLYFWITASDRAALEMLARAEGREPLVLIGDPEYYGRHFGFIADATTNWELPGPFERRRGIAVDRGDDGRAAHDSASTPGGAGPRLP